MAVKQPIREMQGYLRLLSSQTPNMPELKPDGIFGPLTTEAVIAFQRQYETEVTGIVDFNTWDTIYRVYRIAALERNLPHRRRNFPLNNRSYGIGDSGSEIVYIQTILNELSLNFNEFKSLHTLGVFDEDTEKNVKKFQARNGLEETGRVDAATWSSLAGAYDLMKSVSL